MAKKEKINPANQYANEVAKNEMLFKDLLKKVRPELFVIMDLLDQTGVNPMVIIKIIRQLNNIAVGTQYGNVNVYIEKGKVIIVKGEESDKVNEDLIIKTPLMK